MTTSNATNITLTKDGLTVTIATQGAEEILSKGLFLQTPPKPTDTQERNPSSQNYGPNATKIMDILSKAETRIVITGSLDNDSTSTADTKRIDLKKIVHGGGIFNFSYKGEALTGNLDGPLSIKDANSSSVSGEMGVAEFSVRFKIIVGVDLITT